MPVNDNNEQERQHAGRPRLHASDDDSRSSRSLAGFQAYQDFDMESSMSGDMPVLDYQLLNLIMNFGGVEGGERPQSLSPSIMTEGKIRERDADPRWRRAACFRDANARRRRARREGLLMGDRHRPSVRGPKLHSLRPVTQWALMYSLRRQYRPFMERPLSNPIGALPQEKQHLHRESFAAYRAKKTTPREIREMLSKRKETLSNELLRALEVINIVGSSAEAQSATRVDQRHLWKLASGWS
ncbi:MAG: hypothetical protein JW950_06870 [Deltaproteobacteria bacterium]|nr:hypothetical protein [Deltaproteobacteria bacterium]